MDLGVTLKSHPPEWSARSGTRTRMWGSSTRLRRRALFVFVQR